MLPLHGVQPSELVASCMQPCCSCYSQLTAPMRQGLPAHMVWKSNAQLQFGGHVSYNGEPLNKFYPERTAAYVPQVCLMLTLALASATQPLA